MQLKTDLQAVIFDFDGVINDSIKLGLERIIKIVANAGHTIPDGVRDQLCALWGTHGVELIKRAFGLDEAISQNLYREWERMDSIYFFPLVKGARECLLFLERLGLKKALVTSRNRDNLLRVTDHFGLTDMFSCIQCRDDYQFTKPDPRTFRYTLNKMKIFEGKCFYVGDTFGDWQAAKNAGIRFVGVETGLLKRQDWQKAGLESRDIIHDIGWVPVWILKHF